MTTEAGKDDIQGRIGVAYHRGLIDGRKAALEAIYKALGLDDYIAKRIEEAARNGE